VEELGELGEIRARGDADEVDYWADGVRDFVVELECGYLEECVPVTVSDGGDGGDGHTSDYSDGEDM